MPRSTALRCRARVRAALRADIAGIGDAAWPALLPCAEIADGRTGHAIERAVGIVVGSAGRMARTGADREDRNRDHRHSSQNNGSHCAPPDAALPISGHTPTMLTHLS